MKLFCATLLAGFLTLASLAGCGSSPDTVKFDASNAEVAGKSFDKMTTGMTEAQRQEFMARATAVSTLINPSTVNPLPGETLWKGIHGMTKPEIQAKANELLPKKS